MGKRHFSCKMCGVVCEVSGGNAFFRCDACRAMPGRRPRRLTHNAAHAAVSRAIRAGKLAPASSCACADCGGPAIEYDHRDYAHPLRVAPVCRRCNLLRGPARMPLNTVLLSMQRGVVPYKLRRRAHQLLQRLGLSIDCLEGMPAKLTLDHWRTIAVTLTPPRALQSLSPPP